MIRNCKADINPDVHVRPPGTNTIDIRRVSATVQFIIQDEGKNLITVDEGKNLITDKLRYQTVSRQ